MCLELRNYLSVVLTLSITYRQKVRKCKTYVLKLAHLYILSFTGEFDDISRCKKTMLSYLEVQSVSLNIRSNFYDIF